MAGAEAYGVLRALRSILTALALGVLAFEAVGVTLVARNRPFTAGDDTHVLVSVLVLVCLSAVPATIYGTRGLTNRLRPRARLEPDGSVPAPLLRGFRGLRVIQAAFTEGPALLGSVVYLLTAHWLGPVVGALGFARRLLLVPPSSAPSAFVRDLTGWIPDVRRGNA